MTRHEPLQGRWLLLALVVAALLLAFLLWRYRPPVEPPTTEPTPTLRVIVTDPTRPVVLPPTWTATPVPEPTEALPAATSTRVPTETPSATPTPAPPTATPDISKRVERG